MRANTKGRKAQWKRYTLTLPESIHQRAKEIAVANHRNLSNQIAALIENEWTRMQPPKAS